ncbi:cell division protein FtsQ/DivIB [Roseateles sp.]|jgi:cell division protein FtsQ|uniref:cell division protein FtsQ/DivIB n=1 Tax=Roseateles sp. TaxID=1971397 RepID=UPI0037CA76D2
MKPSMDAATQPLPPDIRLMNGVTALLLVGLVLAVLALAVHKLVRLPAFAIRHIQVEGEVDRNSVASLRANALPRLSGNFLTLKLSQGRAAFEAVPWVRRATVQRVWPNQMLVRLEEHQPAAYWETRPEGADGQSDAAAERVLVNSFGEVFQANLGDVEDEDLPVLAGPDGRAAQMLAMWRQLQALTGVLDDAVERLDLSSRGSWRVTLERGAVIELGRGADAEVLARYAQFARSLPEITTHYQSQLATADLRHAEGFAVRLRGVSTAPVVPVRGRAKKT